VHGLLGAAHLAYAEHLPLVLSPDAIWITIAQAVARHVDANAESLRSSLVRHEGQLEIDVRRDHFVRGAENDWSDAVDELAHKLVPHIGGRHDLFVTDFSTTTPTIRAASQICLLSGMQRFFSYSVSSLCGIPSVVLEGTPEDWANVRGRVEALADLGLADWVRVLTPIADQLHAASVGEVDERFWQRIYKPIHASGGDEVTGWINALFPFLDDEGVEPNPAIASWMDGDLRPEARRGPHLSEFPIGLSHAPFAWNYLGDVLPMTLGAGAFGVAQDEHGVRPALGWVVAPRTVARRFVATAEPLFTWPPSHEKSITLRPVDPTKLDRLEGLARETAGIGPFDLSLFRCGRLVSLDGLTDCAVSSLRLFECDSLASLDGLRGLAPIQSLSIDGCRGLRDISAIATLPNLRSLVVTSCPNISDLRPISKLRSLRALVLDELPSLPAPARGRHIAAEAIAGAQAAIS
jgi:hypothetical protein